MKPEERDSLLELLAERVRDKNSLSRGKVLQVWCRLTAARAIPLSFLPKVTDIAVSRIKDKSSTVRKYAVQLLGTLLECNPFSASLKLSQLEAQYEGLKAQLAKLSPESTTTGLEVVEEGDEEEADESEAQEETEANDDETESRAEEPTGEPDKSSGDDKSEEIATVQKKVDYCKSAVLFVSAIHRAMETVM